MPSIGNSSPARDTNTASEHVVVDDAVIDRKDPFEIIDPVWWTADIYEDERRYNQSLAGFSREQRYVFAVAWHLAEVNNGGHAQFYSNSTGIVWKDALAGYREIGLPAAASLLEESAALLGGNPSLDRETREKQLETLEPADDRLESALARSSITISPFSRFPTTSPRPSSPGPSISSRPSSSRGSPRRDSESGPEQLAAAAPMCS
jgi:hypothetical protein